MVWKYTPGSQLNRLQILLYEHLARLTAVLRKADVKSLTVAHMEVPCRFGLGRRVEQAVAASSKDIPFREITIGVRGELKS